MHDLTPVPVASPVGVVTVSYGSELVLGSFLRSVTEATRHSVFVVVADNKPQANSVSSLAAEHGAQYVALEQNPGYGGAINVAMALLPSEVEWVLISNPDVELGVDSIDELLRIARSEDTIGAVGPRILTPEGEVYPSARQIPSLGVGIGHALLSKTWVNNPWTNKYKQENQSGIIQRNAGWLSGACLLVRRSAFEQINGFSRDYFMYFEDVDLGFRLGRHGFRNVYAPSAVVVHVGAHSTENEPAAMIAAHHESAERFLMNRYSGPWLAPLRLAIGIGLKTRSLWTQSRVSRSAGR